MSELELLSSYKLKYPPLYPFPFIEYGKKKKKLQAELENLMLGLLAVSLARQMTFHPRSEIET
jgi:hypothetical protein